MMKRIAYVFSALFLLLSGCGTDVDLILQNGAESSAYETGEDIETGSGTNGREDNAEYGYDESDPAGEMAADVICVYICGAVSQPGVYEVPEHSRIYELVDLAGGMTDEADTDSVNLAQAVGDGDMVRIPTREETSDDNLAAGVVSGDGGVVLSGSGNGSQGAGNKVNINTAGVEELTSLNGIGDVKAAAIVAYREEHGSFGNIEEIMEVSGIGEGTYDKIKEDITI